MPKAERSLQDLLNEGQDASKELKVLGRLQVMIRIASVGIVVGICAIIATVFLTLKKDDLVIMLHYSGWRMAKSISSVVCAIIGVFLVMMGVLIFRTYRQIWPKKSKKVDQPLRDVMTPEAVYTYVGNLINWAKQMGRDSDAYAKQLMVIHYQLDQMNKLQENLESILGSSDKASGLVSSKDLLQDIEDTICGNVKNLLAYLFVSEEDFVERAIEVTKQNKKFLDEAKDILRMIVEFINGDDAEAEAIIMQINAFRKSIHMFANLKGVELDEKIDVTDAVRGNAREHDSLWR